MTSKDEVMILATRWIERFAAQRRVVDTGKDGEDVVRIDVTITTAESKEIQRLRVALAERIA